MSRDTDSEPAPEPRGRIEQEALFRVQLTREQLLSLLYATRVAVKRGDDLVYAPTETIEPVATPPAVLGEGQDVC